MKIPEPLFLVINPAMRLLLRSPLHFVVSSSLMLITFQGRKTGRTHVTPVRYLKDGEVIRCFTARDSRWWPNFKGGAPVELTVAGRTGAYTARIEDDPDAVHDKLLAYFSRFPGDAAYHNVRLNADGTPVADDLSHALRESIVVEATPTNGS